MKGASRKRSIQALQTPQKKLEDGVLVDWSSGVCRTAKALALANSNSATHKALSILATLSTPYTHFFKSWFRPSYAIRSVDYHYEWKILCRSHTICC